MKNISEKEFWQKIVSEFYTQGKLVRNPIIA